MPRTGAFMRPAPVVIFAYMRADHLRRTVESLLANPEAGSTDVIVYCDATKSSAHQPMIDAVRTYAESISGFRSVECIHRPSNVGLMRSVIDGVTKTLAKHGRAIVLEDDLLLSPHFLRYMNAALDRYEHDPQVASIHGYVYPVGEALPETFFLKGADCWGWATWSRGWAHFDADGSKLLREILEKGLVREFDFDGQFPYSNMLRDQIAGRNSSWAILWYASCFLKDLLTLYPGRSLVENIGNDSSGTHCETTDAMSRAPTSRPVQVETIAVQPSEVARAAFVRFFAEQRPWRTRVRSSLKRMLKSRI
ncbi:MAG: glycosyltransferase [Caldimonas sp.]